MFALARSHAALEVARDRGDAGHVLRQRAVVAGAHAAGVRQQRCAGVDEDLQRAFARARPPGRGARPARPAATRRDRPCGPSAPPPPCAGRRAWRRCRRRYARRRSSPRRGRRPARHWPGCAAPRPAASSAEASKRWRSAGTASASDCHCATSPGSAPAARMNAAVVSSGSHSPVWPPSSAVMLESVMRSCIGSARIASPRKCTAWVRPPSMPSWPHRNSIMSLATTHGAERAAPFDLDRLRHA